MSRAAPLWRNLGSAGFGNLQPLGVAGGRWLFEGRTFEGGAVAAALDLTSEQWAGAAAPLTVSTSYDSAGADDTVLAVPNDSPMTRHHP